MLAQQKQLDSNFICKYCHKSFKVESRYLKHKCQQMIKMEEMQSPAGQTAFHYYSLWMRYQKRNPPQPSAFMASKSFRTFVNFVKFAQNVGLVKIDKFIMLMVEKDFPPFMWHTDSVYSLYLNYLQHNTTPKEHFATSLETLMAVADSRNIDITDVFDVLTPADIIKYLRIRKLSPWLLLFSRKFKIMLSERASPEQQSIIDELIQPTVWIELLPKYPQEREQFKKYISEIGL